LGILLAPQGRKFLREIGCDPWGCTAGLQNPVAGRVREITGIAVLAGDTGLRVADFTWDYRDLPGVVLKYAATPTTGAAQFRLYDDGWRVEKVELHYAVEAK
jgi:hypothetical protein